MIKVYTDAAYAQDAQAAGLAIRILGPNQTAEQVFYLQEVADNHQAEFQAVHLALEWLRQLELNQDFIWLHSDSQLVIHSIEKAHVKDPRYAPLLAAILEQLAYFPKMYVKWIPEKANQAADQLAKSSLKRQSSWVRTSIR